MAYTLGATMNSFVWKKLFGVVMAYAIGNWQFIKKFVNILFTRKNYKRMIRVEITKFDD